MRLLKDKRLLTLLSIAFIVLFVLFINKNKLIKWVFGDGRGDWTINITEEYSINKINNEKILISYRKDPDQLVYDSIIPNLSITAYQICNSYICLEGVEIETQTNNDVGVQANSRSYYLINTNDNSICGPFKSEDIFSEYCKSISLDISEDWEEIIPGSSKPIIK